MRMDTKWLVGEVKWKVGRGTTSKLVNSLDVWLRVHLYVSRVSFGSVDNATDHTHVATLLAIYKLINTAL